MVGYFVLRFFVTVKLAWCHEMKHLLQIRQVKLNNNYWLVINFQWISSVCEINLINNNYFLTLSILHHWGILFFCYIIRNLLVIKFTVSLIHSSVILSDTIIFLWAYNVHNNCLVRGDLDMTPSIAAVRNPGSVCSIICLTIFIFFLRIHCYLMTDNMRQLVGLLWHFMLDDTVEFPINSYLACNWSCTTQNHLLCTLINSLHKICPWKVSISEYLFVLLDNHSGD